MYFFFHLFTGIVLGLLIADLVNDRRWVIPCAFGAVLPDLIDKPIGYMVFADVLGNGRILMHSLLVFCGFLMLGLIIWKRSAHPAVLAVALGIFSHQALDLMWQDPRTWYFPLFGPFGYEHGGDYAFVLLRNDISARSEWVLGAVIATAIILFLASRRYGTIISGYRNLWAGVMGAGSIAFFILSGAAIGTGLFPVKGSFFHAFQFFGWTEPVECIIGGIVFLMCAYLLWRMYSSLKKDEMTLSEKE
jgi:LexA-binding, inner membrane-associated putative hydrolase